MAFGDFTVDRNSTKYVLGSGGDIISYATDEPAFEFNSDGSYKGLLVEPAATNLIIQSENINASWSPTNATPTQSTEETPDGDTTNKYIKLVDDGTGGTGGVYVRLNFTVTANTTYTASAFFKADQLAFSSIEANDYDGSTDGRQFFGLSGAGSLGTASNLDDSKIEAYPNGWYRCSITWTQGAADTDFQMRFLVANSISAQTVDLDGTSSVFIWGIQLEEGPIATSYIPTSGSTVTRNADDINLTSASSLIGQTEGTLYVEVDWRLTTGVVQRLLSISDGTANNRLEIYNSGTTVLRMLVDANNDEKTNQGEDSSGYSGIQKIAFAYADTDFELYRNGSSISSDTTGSLAALATITDIDLGQSVGSGNQANMWIRAAALFTRRLSDAEAQALTTL
jgi:hypothetical protein